MSDEGLEGSEHTIAEIRATIESYGKLREAGDVEGIVDLFADQGSIMVPGAPMFAGREALLQAFEPFRNNPGQKCRYEFDEILVGGDRASARTHSSGTVVNRETSEASPASWRELFVLRRTRGRWKIASYMFQSTGG
jgi:uncharacterized protein (TIGR02246 family)